MKLSPMIGGVLMGLTVVMTSSFAPNGGRSTFGTSAALAQDSGEQEAAPAMPAPEPAPYPQAAPQAQYPSSDPGLAAQYQQELDRRAAQIRLQTEQQRLQQEEMQKTINNMR